MRSGSQRAAEVEDKPEPRRHDVETLPTDQEAEEDEEDGE